MRMTQTVVQEAITLVFDRDLELGSRGRRSSGSTNNLDLPEGHGWRTATRTGYGAASAGVKIRRKPRADWLALMPNAHEGYVTGRTPRRSRPWSAEMFPSAVFMGYRSMATPLLAGLIRSRGCGRKLTLRYSGTKHSIPRYSCARGWMSYGEPRRIAFGGLRVDEAIEDALVAPAPSPPLSPRRTQ